MKEKLVELYFADKNKCGYFKKTNIGDIIGESCV